VASTIKPNAPQQLFQIDTDVGERIWELIDTPIAINDLIATIENEFNVPRKIVEKDVRDFIVTLQKNNLATIE
jgi:hypothetical protein